MTERRTIEVVQQFRVARDRHDVYEFLVDTGHFRQVDPALRAFEPGGRMAAGTRGTMHHRRAGLPVRTTWHVAELVPDERLVVGIRGMGYALTEAVSLSDAIRGTTMRVEVRVTGTSALGDLFVLVSRGSIRRDLDARGRRLLTALGAT